MSDWEMTETDIKEAIQSEWVNNIAIPDKFSFETLIGEYNRRAKIAVAKAAQKKLVKRIEPLIKHLDTQEGLAEFLEFWQELRKGVGLE